MAIVVKMPASELPIKVTDIDSEFFNANIFDVKKDDFEFFSVSKFVNSPQNNSIKCIEPSSLI